MWVKLEASVEKCRVRLQPGSYFHVIISVAL